MWDLSDHLGEGVQALMTDHVHDFFLPQKPEQIFSDGQENFLASVGIDSGLIFNIRQAHGGKVLNVGTLHATSLQKIPEADGAVTNRKDVVLAVRTADCIPIFLYDPVKKSIGLVHAGWRSTQQEIVGEALTQMARNFQSCPADLKVVLGPCIHGCCYCVGREFCDIFPEHMISRDGNYFLDLSAVNIQQLENGGVRRENINDSGLCTYCNDRFFSFRRDGEKAGRHLSLLRITENG